LVDGWMATYDLLVHVPIGGEPSADGVRAVDPVFQRVIDERLEKELAARGFSSLRLVAGERTSWIDRVEEAVLSRLGPRQLLLDDVK
jgi:hypothetical protein